MPDQDKADWDIEDWQAAFDERAGILEYDEGLPRKKAEALARQWLIEQRGSADGIVTAKASPPLSR